MSLHNERVKALIESITAEVEALEAAKQAGPAPWWKKYVKYNLTAYPTNVPEKDVTIDLSGDIDTHAVMTWVSPKTGRRVYSYTKTFAANQAAKKWDRTSKMSQEKIDNFTTVTAKVLTGKGDDKTKQAAAINAIIAQTGLRPGSIKGFYETGNRGVSTLAPENVTINGNKISLDFTGKSGVQNIAQIVDGPLASYLQSRLTATKGQPFLFDVPRYLIDDFYKRVLKMGNFKIKDLRTHTAGELAKQTLASDTLPPPPIPDNPKELKKMVKKKLTHVFDVVSKKLNNTPAMAKGSYIRPSIIDDWLKGLGIEVQMQENGMSTPYKTPIEEEEEVEFIGDAPIYKLPAWWNNDNLDLIKAD